MSASQADFVASNLSKLGYSSKRDIIEKLYIASLRQSYQRITKSISTENEIRDRFCDDLYKHPQSSIRNWLQLRIIYLDWENWGFASDGTKTRSDFNFKFSGMQFVIECKRLSYADKAYIDEGLERFVTLKYAQGDEYAGMIGFVISGDQYKISEGLQKKIKILDHTLAVIPTSPVPLFNTSHKRSDASEIELYHMFFDFVIV